MAASSLPAVDCSPPELRGRSVFVTQPQESSSARRQLEPHRGATLTSTLTGHLFPPRQRTEESVNHIPAVHETLSHVLDGGVTTFQKNLVLKKRAELQEVDRRLEVKQLEFRSSVEALADRRSQLEAKQKQTRERVMKFEKFVAENEAKRRRAIKKCEAMREENILKQREIEGLTERLTGQRARKQVLKERMQKHQIFEDYLMTTQEYLPGHHLENEFESLVLPVIRRHETLSVTHQELLLRLRHMEEEVEQGQSQLQKMMQAHSIKKLMSNKEVSELQAELERLRERSQQAEVNLQMEQGLSRERFEEVGRLLVAINNMAEQCYLPAYGALEDMTLLTKMDMVKEYILDKADTERRTRRLLESGSAMTSMTALTEKRSRTPRKGIGSKTQIISSSKVSKRSAVFS